MDRFRNTRLPDQDAWRSDGPAPVDLFEALGLDAGTSLAIVCAGAGHLALPAATHVSPGTVYAVDRDGTVADELDALALDQDVENLVTIAAGANVFAAELPDLVDAVLLVDALGTLDAPTAFAEQASRALQPGGQLLVVDGAPATAEDGSPLSPGAARRLVAIAGFEPVRELELPSGRYALVFERAHDR